MQETGSAASAAGSVPGELWEETEEFYERWSGTLRQSAANEDIPDEDVNDEARLTSLTCVVSEALGWSELAPY